MKQYTIFLLSLMLLGCAGNSPINSGDFRSPSERAEDDRRGSVFGKDRLGVRWSKDENERSDVAQQDPVWVAANIVLSQYPISFSNFSSKIIQTGWFNDESDVKWRHRVTVRLIGKLPDEKSVNVLVFSENLKNNIWETAPPKHGVRHDVVSKILSEALRIFDQQKKQD